jgi:CAAX prenyl protease-like protein
MKRVLRYITEFFRDVNKPVLLLCTVQTAILVFLNYQYSLEKVLTSGWSLPGYYFLFLFAFALPYLYYSIFGRKKYFQRQDFLVLLAIAPLIFAIKMSVNTHFYFTPDPGWNIYWNKIIYWPARLLLVVPILFIVWKWYDAEQPFYGLTTKNFNWRPYLFMLLIMLPLVAAASAQKDFLQMYPRIQTILAGIGLDPFHKFLFELSYGSDFFGIELFFRGFLVLAFIKIAGKDAVLPMACFYCTIHFGKPLGECISSYFGGIVLGIVVANTRSIWGGLMVHLGIAWLMEIGGYVGNG